MNGGTPKTLKEALIPQFGSLEDSIADYLRQKFQVIMLKATDEQQEEMLEDLLKLILRAE